MVWFSFTDTRGKIRAFGVKVIEHFLLWTLGLKEAETQTTPLERDCLAFHATGKKRLAEIGVWHGVTTCRLREAMAPDGTIFAVDPFAAGKLGFSMQRLIALREVSKIRNGAVEWIRQTGEDAARTLQGTGPFDFLFIDGDHSYDGLRADWSAWKPLVAERGIIALHDSCPTRDRPIDDAGSVVFTREVILKDPHFELEATVDSLSVLRCTR